MDRKEQIDAIVARVLADNKEIVSALESLSPGIKETVRLSIRLGIAHVVAMANAEWKSNYVDVVLSSSLPQTEEVNPEDIPF